MKYLSEIFKLFLIILISTIFFSCEYKNEDVNFVEIDKNVEPPNLTSSLDFYSDTIYFRQDYSTGWEFNCEKEILMVQFLVDGAIYKEFQKTISGYLNFEDSYYPQVNFRKLTCRVYVKSGTGSIADKLNAEALYLQKEWVAVFVPSSFQPSVLSKIYRDSLDIVVEYNRYSGPDFQAYYLVKNYQDTIAATNNQDLLKLSDITYSGEEATYELITSVKSEAELNKSDRKVFQDYPEYKVTNIGNNNYRISIPKNKYNSRLKSIRFYEQTSYYDEYNLLNEVQSASDVSFIIQNVKFQPAIFYQIMFVPKTNLKSLEIPYNFPKYSINLRSLGSDFIDYNFIKGGMSPHVYIADTKGNVLCYNTNSEKITDTLSSNPGYPSYFGVSASRKKAIINTGKNTFKIINSEDNSIEYTINSGDLQTDVTYTSIALSDNGLFVYFNYSTIIVYDFINKKVVQKFPAINTGNYLHISPDGSIVTTDTDIYIFKDGSYTYYGNISGTVISADPNNSKQIYYHSFYNLVLYNYETMQVIRSVPILNSYCNIDWDSNSIIYVDNNKLVFKNLETGEISNTLDLRNSNSAYNFKFYNKALFFHDNSSFILKFE